MAGNAIQSGGPDVTPFRAIVILLAIAAALPAVADEPATTTVDTLLGFNMVDQYDEERTDLEVRDRVAVLLWADRKGSDQAPRWSRMLERKLAPELDAGTATIRTVANVRGVPGFVKGQVKAKFRENDAPWAYLDWDGLFADAYAPQADHLNIMVFDAGGRLVHRAAVTKLEQGALDDAIEAVRGAMAAGP